MHCNSIVVQRLLVEKVKSWKTASYSIAPPKWKWAVHFYKVATHKAFDWLMIVITLVYCSLILADVILNSQYRGLEIAIHLFYPVYIAEFVIKVCHIPFLNTTTR